MADQSEILKLLYGDDFAGSSEVPAEGDADTTFINIPERVAQGDAKTAALSEPWSIDVLGGVGRALGLGGALEGAFTINQAQPGDTMRRLQNGADFAAETGNNASFGLLDLAGKNINRLLPGQTGEDYDAYIEGRKERLGTQGELAALGVSMVANPAKGLLKAAQFGADAVRGGTAASQVAANAISKVGDAAGNIDRWVQGKGSSRILAPAARAGRQGLLGSASVAGSDILMNPEDYDASLGSLGKVATNAGIGFAGGVGGQAVLGEIGPRLIKSFKGNNAMSDVYRDLVSKVPDDTPDALSRNVINNAVKRSGEDAGFLDMDLPDNLRPELNARVAASISKNPLAEHGSMTDNPGNPARARDVQKLTEEVDGYIDRQVGAFNSKLENARGPTTTAEQWDIDLAKDPNLAKGRDLFNQLEDTEGLGGLPLAGSWDEFATKVGDKYASELGRGSILDVSNKEGSTFNELLTANRAYVQGGASGKLKREAQADHHTPQDQLQPHQKKDLTPPTVARAVVAAKEFNQRRIGDIFNKDTITPTDMRTYFSASKTLNDTIAEAVGDVHKDAREAFSTYMHKSTGFDLGYGGGLRNRSFEDARGKRTTMGTMLGSMSADQADAVKSGAKAFDAEEIGEKGFNRFMADLIGRGKSEAVPDPAKVNAAGEDYLRAVYGKDNADKMIKLYKDNGDNMASLALLKASTKYRGDDPTASVSDPTRAGDMLTLGFSEGDMISAAKLGSAYRVMSARGPKHGEALVDLITPQGAHGKGVQQKFDAAAAMKNNTAVNPFPLGASMATSNAEDEREGGGISGWLKGLLN
jgi:hypothetical protein